jgi:hypothetical protein
MQSLLTVTRRTTLGQKRFPPSQVWRKQTIVSSRVICALELEASFPYEPLEVHDLEDDDVVNVAPSEKPNYGYYLARRDPVSSVSEVNDIGGEDGDIAMADVEM